MPREIYLLSSQPVTLPALVAAGAEVDDQLAVRTLYAGATWQLVDESDVAVVTIEGSRLLADPADIARVTRGFGADVEALRGAGPSREAELPGSEGGRSRSGGSGGSSPRVEGAGTWWTELFVPWGAAGDPGVRIARNLGRVLGGSVRVEDGR